MKRMTRICQYWRCKSVVKDERKEMKEKKEYISCLNFISCLAVVMLHANGVYWNFSKERYWITANVIESVLYFAVPVFFMISGVTLIDYRERYTTKEYFKKRAEKTLLPFLVWSLIGFFYLLYFKQIDMESLSVRQIISSILNTKYVTIYWFFPSLFGVYVSLPFLGYVPKEKRKESFGYLIVMAFFLNSLFPLVCRLTGIQYNNELRIAEASGYIFWVIAGYYLDTFEISKNRRHLLYVAGVSGLLLHCLGTWYLSFERNAIDNTFKGYMGVPCVLYAASIFVFFKYSRGCRWLTKIASVFEKETFGIYLVHWFLLDLLLKFGNVDNRSIIFRIFGGLALFIVSGILVKILRKIPGIKRILP